MTNDESTSPHLSNEERDTAAAAEWMAKRADGDTSGDIDGLITVDDAANPPDPDAYGSAETDTLASEDHAPASRRYPTPDAHGGITEADRRS